VLAFLTVKRNAVSLWDDEKNIEMLKKLWAEGLTASQIANRIPGATRSGICGKAFRLKLPPRTDKARRMDGGPATWGKAPTSPRRSPKRREAKVKPRLPTLSPEEMARYIRPASEDIADGGLEERRNDQCCFPVGDPLKPGFGYCKNDREIGDYCTSHFLRMRPGAVVKLRDLEVKEKAKEAEPA
jgi:GcrA cell cycle regulator